MRCHICDKPIGTEVKLGDPCKECQGTMYDPEEDEDTFGEVENLDEDFFNEEQWEDEDNDYLDDLPDSDDDTEDS